MTAFASSKATSRGGFFSNLLLDHALIGRALVAFIIAYGAVFWWLLFFDYNDVAAVDNVDGSKVLNQVIWFAVFGISLVNWLASRARTSFTSYLPVVWPALCYLILALLSVAWALAPDIALRRLVLQAIFLASAFFAMSVIDDRRHVLHDLIWVFAMALLINLATVMVRPPTPLGHAGIYGHKNVLGLMSALAVITGLSGLFSRRFLLAAISTFCIGAGMLLLVMSQSKTSLALAIIAPGLSIFLVMTSQIARIHLGVMFSVMIAFVTSVVVIAKDFLNLDRETLLTFLVGDPTFTGRTIIWDFVARHIDQRYWLGHGYNSYWGIGPEAPAIREGYSFLQLIYQAHNGYIDIFLELGILGLIFITLTIIRAISALQYSSGWSKSDRIMILALIIFVLVHNLMESSLFRSTALVWSIFVILILLIASGRGLHNLAISLPRFSPPRFRSPDTGPVASHS
jgi:exopolysaccharide production protein ExoQ